MYQPSRPAWARLPFMVRAPLNPAPPAPVEQPAPTPTPAPPPVQPLQPRAPFGQVARPPGAPTQVSQPQEPTPPPSPPSPPPSPPPAAAPPAPARSPPRSPVAPPVPAPPPALPTIQPPQPRPPFRPLAGTPAVPPQEPTPPPPPAATPPPRSPVAPPVPAPSTALPTFQPPQPRPPFRPLAGTPAVLPQEPTPPPPPAATPPPRSPVAPPVPAPSTPRRSPISAPPTAALSPKHLASSPARETTTAAASKSPIINTLPHSPVPKEPVTAPTNLPVPSSPFLKSPKTERQAPSPSMSAYPMPKPVASAALESSLKTVKPLQKSPVQSPKPKPVIPPPSPFTLPPSQIRSDSERESKIPTKVDQKDVLVQETIEKLPKLTLTNLHCSSIASNGKQELPKEKVPNKKISDSEKLGMSVITLAGENKGAVMELNPSRNKKHSITHPHSLHKNGNYAKLQSEGEKSSSDEEGISNKEKNNKSMVMQSPPMTAYVNSNVQGVNNSIFFNGSSTHQNPGVHLSINRKANGGHGIHLKDHHA